MTLNEALRPHRLGVMGQGS